MKLLAVIGFFVALAAANALIELSSRASGVVLVVVGIAAFAAVAAYCSGLRIERR